MFQTNMDRYSFSAIVDRPTYEWPNGARLAVYFALNVEAFEFGRNPGTDFTSAPAAPFHRGYAYRDYGNRVGAWRIKRAFDEAQLPLAILANTAVYDACPRVLAAFRARGDEFVGHGRTNSERQIEMPRDLEAAMIADVASCIGRHEGRRPTGWLGPFISQSGQTPEILKAEGFQYMLDWWFDDQPVWFRTDNVPIPAVPYPSMELNDVPAYINRGASDEEFHKMTVDAFDELLEESAHYPMVYCVSLHTFLTGQPHRIRLLKKLLEHIGQHRSRVWLTTPGQIAAHVAGLPAGVVPTAG